VNLPKYARLEIERRWLAVPEALPDLTTLDGWIVRDRYLEGARLRLRHLVGVRSGEQVFKICKKYGKTGGCAEPITNLYLDAAEHALLDRLPGALLKKRKLRLERGGRGYTIDVHEGANADLVLVEVELESETAAAELIPPPFCGEEVTGDPDFEGLALAKRYSGA
jgi:CYTH domain-containing protein